MPFSKLAILVQGTDTPKPCSVCGQPLGACVCARPAQATGSRVPAQVRVGRETKGRAGKGVTVISGLDLDAQALEKLATELKKRCGSGGTVREGVIEIQGEQREILIAELARRGFNAKRAGG